MLRNVNLANKNQDLNDSNNSHTSLFLPQVKNEISGYSAGHVECKINTGMPPTILLSQCILGANFGLA